jgi:hypothetical protein
MIVMLVLGAEAALAAYDRNWARVAIHAAIIALYLAADAVTPGRRHAGPGVTPDLGGSTTPPPRTEIP